MKSYDTEMLRWVREPDFNYLGQDFDAVLMAVFDATELCQLLASENLPDRKKHWVIEAMLGLIAEEISKVHADQDQILIQQLSSAFKKSSALCQNTIPEMSASDAILLKEILGGGLASH